MKNVAQLRSELSDFEEKAGAILDAADNEGRDLTEEEEKRWDALAGSIKDKKAEIAEREKMDERGGLAAVLIPVFVWRRRPISTRAAVRAAKVTCYRRNSAMTSGSLLHRLTSSAA